MPPRELLDLLRRQPFVPFRIHLSDGTTYDIRHSELVMVGIASATICIPTDPNQPELYGRTEIIALRHVIRLQPELV